MTAGHVGPAAVPAETQPAGVWVRVVIRWVTTLAVAEPERGAAPPAPTSTHQHPPASAQRQHRLLGRLIRPPSVGTVERANPSGQGPRSQLRLGPVAETNSGWEPGDRGLAHPRRVAKVVLDAVLGGVAVVLLLVIAGSVGDSWTSGGFGDGVVDTESPTPRGSPSPVDDLPIANANYISVRPDQRTLDVVIDVTFSASYLESFHALDDGAPVFSCTTDCRPTTRYSNQPGKIEWFEGNRRSELSFALRDLRPISAGAALSLPVELTVIGTPLRFPDDEYRTEALLVGVYLPAGIGIGGDYIPSDDDTSLVATAVVQDAAGLGDYSANVTAIDQNLGQMQRAIITVDRKSHVRRLIYAVAAAPLLLIALAVRQWLSNSDTGTGFASLELAAALLAILPLREALVPDGLGGVTRLDYVLAGEVVLIIAVVTLIGTVPAFLLTLGSTLTAAGVHIRAMHLRRTRRQPRRRDVRSASGPGAARGNRPSRNQSGKPRRRKRR